MTIASSAPKCIFSFCLWFIKTLHWCKIKLFESVKMYCSRNGKVSKDCTPKKYVSNVRTAVWILWDIFDSSNRWPVKGKKLHSSAFSSEMSTGFKLCFFFPWHMESSNIHFFSEAHDIQAFDKSSIIRQKKKKDIKAECKRTQTHFKLCKQLLAKRRRLPHCSP